MNSTAIGNEFATGAALEGDNAANNSGNGSSASRRSSGASKNPGAGGSGIVVIRYEIAPSV
jgi:hypothetical protein